jgi:riboflavin kinase/FMN adenylyltransferase
MQLIRYLDKPLKSPSAVAIGNFDGLHLGHQAVIAQMQALAARHGLVPTVLTFEPHPRAFFTPHTQPFKLESLPMKLRHLREAGVECLAMPRFDAAFAALTPEQFLHEVLGTQLKAKAVITGDNFAFGAKRAGTSDGLRAWGKANGIIIETVEPVVMADGTVCSSTAVRASVSEGNMVRAAQLLGRPYAIAGRVMHGDKRGHGLGFPTANVAVPLHLKLPATGVYAVRARVIHSPVYAGKTYDAVANFGLRPTVANTTAPRLEAHLFDFAGDLYGARLEIDFIARLREEKRFDTLAALTAQIAADCVDAKTALRQRS